MKKITLLLSSFILFSMALPAQTGYDIKINLKGCKDSMIYLIRYTFDQNSLVDTCKKIKNGNIQFKGKTDLDKGVYVLVSEEKVKIFEFFVNENERFTINAELSDIPNSLKISGNKENEQFFSYMKFINNKNVQFGKLRDQTKGKNKADSAKFMSDKLNELNLEVKNFESNFVLKNKGTYLDDVMNLKREKEPIEVPKAKNGRPDSVYQYYYYKNHYFDGIDFKDDRILHTPFFADRFKRYFESVIAVNPDTLIAEIDKVMAKCKPESQMYSFLVSYFTYSAEQNKVMGFDKVFVHMADTYILPGKAKGTYTDETTVKIKERVDIMRNLLLGAKVSDLFMIDTTYGRQVLKMGFDTAKTSKSITDLYYKNLDKLTPMFKTLYQVKTKYTILLFWAADCGHCKTEVPKLNEALKDIKGKIDFKVYAVQTKEELFDSWRKF